ALGPVARGGVITVNNPGSLQVLGSFTVSKILTLNGLGLNSGGALQLVGGSTAAWAGPITIGADGKTASIFVETGSQLTVTGIISGGGTSTLEKDGAGLLILDAANKYTGPTALREGTTLVTN